MSNRARLVRRIAKRVSGLARPFPVLVRYHHDQSAPPQILKEMGNMRLNLAHWT